MLPAMVMTHKLTLMILGISTDFSTSIFRIFSYYFQESNSQTSLWLARISIFRFLFSCPTLLPYHIYTPLELAANLHDFFYSPFSNRRHSPHSRNSQTPLWLARIPIFRFLFSCPTLLPYHIYTPLELAANLHDFSIFSFQTFLFLRQKMNQRLLKIASGSQSMIPTLKEVNSK